MEVFKTLMWSLPRSMLGDLVSEETVQAMAGAGYITIQA